MDNPDGFLPRTQESKERTQKIQVFEAIGSLLRNEAGRGTIVLVRMVDRARVEPDLTVEPVEVRSVVEANSGIRILSLPICVTKARKCFLLETSHSFAFADSLLNFILQHQTYSLFGLRKAKTSSISLSRYALANLDLQDSDRFLILRQAQDDPEFFEWVKRERVRRRQSVNGRA